MELSPNSLAKCQTCRCKIVEHEPRIGKEIYFARYKAYCFQYYHQACFNQTSLPFSSSAMPSHSELVHQPAQAQAMLRQRSELRVALKELRASFAKRLNRSHFLIFDDSVLNQLVLRLPSNKQELLQVNGFKEKRYQCFGEPILQVIRQFRYKFMDRSDKKQASEPIRNLGASANHAIVINDSEDGEEESRDDDGDSDDAEANSSDDDVDDSEIVVGETLTCEEIVNRKFAHAAANNYLISVDL